MKKIQLLIMMLLFAAASFAQTSTPKVYAVINRADWCKVCKANGQRVEKDVVAGYKENSNVVFIINDLTNDDTKAASKITLDNNGIYETLSGIKSTGLIILIDADTKKVIEKISVKEDTATLKKEIDEAIKG